MPRRRAPQEDTIDWAQELTEWMAPFQAALGHKGRQRWAPVYLQGLLGPGDRKSVQPMAARVAPDDHCPRHGGEHLLRQSLSDGVHQVEPCMDIAKRLRCSGRQATSAKHS